MVGRHGMFSFDFLRRALQVLTYMSALLVVSFAAPEQSGAASYTWVGASSNWNTATNWSPGVVPTATDDVVINASTMQPSLTTAVTVNNITISPGASMSIGIQLLTVTGSINASGGPINGTGTVRMIGTGVTVQGAINPSVETSVSTASVTLAGATALGGNVTVKGGFLDFTGFDTTISGNLTASCASGCGLIKMTGATPYTVYVNGNFSVSGANTSGFLTGGTLAVRGNFISFSMGTFAPTGTKVRLDGTVLQLMDFAGFADSTTGFWDLEINNPVGVQIQTNISIINSMLVSNGSVTSLNASSRLYLYGSISNIGTGTLSISKMTYNNTGLMNVPPNLVTNLELAGNGAVSFPVGFNQTNGLTIVMATLTTSEPLTVNGPLTLGNPSSIYGGYLTLGGDLIVNGNTNLYKSSRLVLTGFNSTFNGDFTNQDTSEFRMLAGAYTVDVNGSFTNYSSTSTSGMLTGGTLRVSGNFITSINASPSMQYQFVSTGTAVVLDGSGPQNLELYNSWTNCTRSRFNDLQIQNTSGVTIKGNVLCITGALSGASWTLISNGAMVTTTNIDIAEVTFDRVLLTVGDGPTVNINTVSFQNYLPTDTQLTFSRTSMNVTMNNVDFLNFPTTGNYIYVNDTNGGTDSALTLTNVTPMHGLPKTTKLGGFVIINLATK